MLRFIIWLIFFYTIYYFIKSLIRYQVNKRVKDYEARKEDQRRKEKEIKIDRKNIEDAKFKDIE